MKISDTWRYLQVTSRYGWRVSVRGSFNGRFGRRAGPAKEPRPGQAARAAALRTRRRVVGLAAAGEHHLADPVRAYRARYTQQSVASTATARNTTAPSAGFEQRGHGRVLVPVERPLVLPDHDRVPPPVRIGQLRDQRSAHGSVRLSPASKNSATITPCPRSASRPAATAGPATSPDPAVLGRHPPVEHELTRQQREPDGDLG